MRTAALFAIAVLFASAVRAAAPKPEDWYTPETYADEGNTGSLYFNGNTPVTVSLDANGNILGGKEIEKEIGKDFRLKTALGAIQMALKNTKQIQTMGKNLNDLLILNGFKITSKDGGIYTVRVGNGSQSIKDVIRSADKGTIPATSDRILADNITIDWRTDGYGDQATKTLQLKGAKDAMNLGNGKTQWYKYAGSAHFMPFLSYGDPGNLVWSLFGGFDDTAFGEVPTEQTYKNGVPLTLKDWRSTDTHENTTMSRLLTESNNDTAELRQKLNLVARKTIAGQESATVGLVYVPIGDVISGLGLPPDGASIEDHIEGNTTNLAIKGWYVNAADEGVVLADLMTSEKSEGAQSGPTYHVLLRKLGEGGETNSIAYASLGDLHKMSWSTNWYNAVKDIAEDRATAIVNWNTNWVYLAGEIAKSKEATERYVDNALNWSTNWFASTTAMNASQAEIKKYIDGQLDIITNALNAIESAKASVTSINNVKQYIDSVMDYQTNVIIATERAKTSGAIESTQKLVNDTFDILTNELAAIDKVVKDTGIEINTVKDYVDAKFDFETNVIVNTELAKLNGTVKSVSEFVDKTYDILTNQIDGINKVVESKQAQTIQTTKDYVQSVMDFQTNLIINTELAKLNETVKSTKELIDETYDILTNELQGIHKTMDDESVDFINSVKDYVDRRFDIETNVIVSVEMAKQNHSIEDVRTFVNDTFELITNRLNGIDNLIKSGEVASIHDVASYIDAQLDIETNIVKATELAQANKSIADIKAFVDDTYTILTNTLAAIDNLKKDSKVGISSVKDYVDAKLNIDTNLVSVLKIAEMNKSIESIRDFVRDSLEASTNLVASINDFVEGQHIDGVRTISDYMRWKMNYETNLLEKIAQANKKMGELDAREFATFVTNLYQNTYEVENWTIITNVFITYMGGKLPNGGGGGGGVDAPLELPPTKDPYKEDFVKEEKYFDYLLPVKNGWMISHMTNDLWGVVNAEHALDNMSLYTNEAHRAEIQGYEEAETNKMPVKVKLEQPKTDSDGNPILYGIEWMDYPTALVAITSKDIDKIQKWLKVMQTENIFTLVASNTEKVAMLQTAPYNVINANTLLDNASIWTNDNFLAEVKGFQHAPYGTVPVKSMGAVGNEWKWEHPATPDSEVMVDVGQGGVAYYNRSLVRQDGYGAVGASNVWSLCGFENANEGEVPSAHTDEFGNKELKWGLTGNAVRVVGTDGSEAVVGVAAQTNTLTFASAADSNVQVGVQGDGNGNVTITIGVYYLNNASVQPPYAE